MLPLVPTQPFALLSGALLGPTCGAGACLLGYVAAASASYGVARGAGAAFARAVVKEEVEQGGADDEKEDANAFRLRAYARCNVPLLSDLAGSDQVDVTHLLERMKRKQLAGSGTGGAAGDERHMAAAQIESIVSEVAGDAGDTGRGPPIVYLQRAANSSRSVLNEKEMVRTLQHYGKLQVVRDDDD